MARLIQYKNSVEWSCECQTMKDTCTINLREDSPACCCNLPQLQKLPYAYVIAACAKERLYQHKYLLFMCIVV